MRLLPVSLVLLAVALGCSGASVGDLVPTYAGYQARLDALTGKSVNVAVAELGAPTRMMDLAAGSKLYIWEEKSELRTPITGEERHNPQTGSDTIVLTPSQRVPLDCFTELETDAAGIVVRSRTEGAACVATPPGPDYAKGATSAVPAMPVPVPTPVAVAAPAPVPTVPTPTAPTGATAGDAVPADATAEATPAATEERGLRRPNGERMRQARPRRDRNRE